MEKMLSGTNIALITDAGTPGISDPGEELAAMCYEAGIQVTSLAGACCLYYSADFVGAAYQAFCL